MWTAKKNCPAAASFAPTTILCALSGFPDYGHSFVKTNEIKYVALLLCLLSSPGNEFEYENVFFSSSSFLLPTFERFFRCTFLGTASAILISTNSDAILWQKFLPQNVLEKVSGRSSFGRKCTATTGCGLFSFQIDQKKFRTHI
jgi:hypothetical protein